MDRRTVFTLCLQSAGSSVREFAAKAGVSETFLHRNLNGDRTCRSRRVEALIDQFIKEHLPQLRDLVESAENTLGMAA